MTTVQATSTAILPEEITHLSCPRITTCMLRTFRPDHSIHSLDPVVSQLSMHHETDQLSLHPCGILNLLQQSQRPLSLSLSPLPLPTLHAHTHFAPSPPPPLPTALQQSSVACRLYNMVEEQLKWFTTHTPQTQSCLGTLLRTHLTEVISPDLAG